MRKTWLGIALVFVMGSAIADTPFCNGYENGYKRGYCNGQFGCVAPIAPICPIPQVNEDSYQDGYDRGFQDGQASAH